MLGVHEMQALFLMIIGLTFAACSIATPVGDPGGPFLGMMALVVTIAACFSLKTGDES